MRSKIKEYFPYIILILSLALTLIIAWPGYMTDDSYTQYNMAKSGVYTDHHPPMMSFIWRYLDFICQGSGLMLVLHLFLLYGASAYGVSLFNKKNTNIQHNYAKIGAYFFSILPLFPIILIYSCKIWKDVGFAFSFLLTIMMLTHAFVTQRKINIIEHLLFWTVLFYGTCVKFQAQYSAPVIIAGYVYVTLRNSLILKQAQQQTTILANTTKFKMLLCTYFLLISSLFYGTFFYINNLLVPMKQKSNAWEYVKIYDLAAISLDSKIMYVPKFLHNNNFTIQKFQKDFHRNIVDYLVLTENAVFHKTKNSKQAKELWNIWVTTIAKHPFLYLKHRAMNFGYTLIYLPTFHIVKDILDKNLDSHSMYYKILYYSAGIIGYILVGHILMAILSIFYLFLGVINVNKTWMSFPLIILNSVNFIMLFSFFFFTMAGVPRYTYIVACLTTASHIFAWLCLKNTKKVKSVD